MPEKRISYDKQRPRLNSPIAPLSAIRVSHGLTLKQVCERVEAFTSKPYSIGALSGLENGHRGASQGILDALEHALNLPAGTLATEYAPSHSRRKQTDLDELGETA